MSAPAITVCVPVFNAAGFLAETLDSIAAQTFSEIKVLLSLDRGEDDSEAVCRRYLADRRFELIVQPARLNWVGNVNALIARVETPYFCVAPHDDILDRRYLAEVHRLAESDPVCACVYSDIQRFGAEQSRVTQREIRGSTLDRSIDFLLNHFAGVAFRGLIRRSGPEDRPYLPTGVRRNFAADTVWTLQLALRGELRRVPEALCSKRYHEKSVHAGWLKWPREELTSLWAEQAALCARLALQHVKAPRDRELVIAAALMRSTNAGGIIFPTPNQPLEVAAVTAIFYDQLGDLSLPHEVQKILAQSNLQQLRSAIWQDPAINPWPSFPRRFARGLRSLWREIMHRY